MDQPLCKSSSKCKLDHKEQPTRLSHPSMKRIAILGSTGSIGRSTLSIVESYPERFQVVSLAAGRNVDAAFEQAVRWKPRLVSMASRADAETLQARLKQASIAGVEIA